MLCHGWVVAIIAFIQREVHIHCVVAFRPAGTELCVFTSILGRLPEEGDVGDMGPQAGTERSNIVRPYAGDITLRLREEVSVANSMAIK
jgi:hypothetical protein